MISNRRLRALLGGVLLVLCSCQDAPRVASDPEPRHDPFASTAQSDALGKVDLVGPEGSEIAWRLPRVVRRGSPVDVARHLVALYELAQVPGTRSDPALVSAFTTEADLYSVRHHIMAGDKTGKVRGPRRVWLAETDDQPTNPRTTMVTACVDGGELRYDNDLDPWDDEGLLLYIHLARVWDFDGRRVWKSELLGSSGLEGVDLPFEVKCRPWVRRQ